MKGSSKSIGAVYIINKAAAAVFGTYPDLMTAFLLLSVVAFVAESPHVCIESHRLTRRMATFKQPDYSGMMYPVFHHHQILEPSDAC